MVDEYILETDGSHNTHFPYSGLGGVLYKNGEVMDYFSLATTLEPHYHESVALLYGLLLAKKHNIDNLVCKGDASQLMRICNTPDKEFRNTFYAKNSIFPELSDLIETFDNISFEHHFREENKPADFLAGLYKINGGVSATPKDLSFPSYINDHIISHEGKPLRNVLNKHSMLFNITEGQENDLNINVIEYKSKSNILTKQYQKVENDIEKVFSAIFNIVAPKIDRDIPIIITGLHAGIIDREIINQRHTGKCLKDSFIYLSANLEVFKNVDTPVITKIRKQKEHMPSREILTEQQLIDYIRILGEDDYQLGNRPDIEDMFDLPQVKKESVAEIQKIYFGKFVNIGINAKLNDFKKYTTEEKQEVLEFRKQILIDKGVRLRL